MAASASIRVRETTRRALADLAERRGRPMIDVLDDIVERAAADGGVATRALDTVRLQLEPHEASDLCRLDDRETLERNGWDLAYVTVLDDTAVEEAVAVLGHQAGGEITEGWSAHRVHCVPQAGEGRTEDAEACAWREGFFYVIGSQYGSGDGPLQPKRAFLARLRAEDLRAEEIGHARPPLTVARNRFLLHRAINDALHAAPIELLERRKQVRKRFIKATVKRGKKKSKRWAGRVRPGDVPINIEAARFRPDGTLLLGLRHPCTSAGEAILVELADVDHLIDDEDATPQIGRIWTLPGIGRPGEPVGFRALHTDGDDRYEAVVGNLDSMDKDSVLLADHPEGALARSQHVRFRLPARATKSSALTDVERVHEWVELRRVEGLASGPEGTFLFVTDDDERVSLHARVAA